MDYSIYSRSSIQGFCHLIFSILHQIHIVNAPDIHLYQLQTWFFSAKPSCIQLCIKTKSFRCKPVKPGCHWSARLWPSLSSYYLCYPIKKLMSHYKRKRPIAFNKLLNLTTNCSAQRW